VTPRRRVYRTNVDCVRAPYTPPATATASLPLTRQLSAPPPARLQPLPPTLPGGAARLQIFPPP
jgi:hypothetical protein